MFAVATHVANWPLPAGSQSIAYALAARLRSLGGKIETGRRVRSLSELESAGAYLCDVTPRQLEEIAGPRLSDRYRAQLRSFRYGPGVFKLDYALDGPIPWRAKDCLRAGTVHLGGTLDEIAESEAQIARERPPSQFCVDNRVSSIHRARSRRKHPSGHTATSQRLDLRNAGEWNADRALGPIRTVFSQLVMGPAEVIAQTRILGGDSVSGATRSSSSDATVLRLDPSRSRRAGLPCSSSNSSRRGRPGMRLQGARRALRHALPSPKPPKGGLSAGSGQYAEA